MRRHKTWLAGTGMMIILGLCGTACQRIAPPSVSQPVPGASVTESGRGNGTSAPEKTTQTFAVSAETTVPETTPAETTETAAETTTPVTTPAVTTRPLSATTRQTTSASTEEPTVSPWMVFVPGQTDNKKGSIKQPYRVGEVARFDGYGTLFDPFRADVSVQQVFRGNEALQMVKDASPLNPSPNPGQEYLIAQVLVKITASKNSEQVDLSPYYFSLARENGRIYGDVTLFRAVTPVLSALKIGETSIGYICFQIDKTDTSPYIVFLSRAHGGTWFKTTPNDEEPDVTGTGNASASPYSYQTTASQTYRTYRTSPTSQTSPGYTKRK